MRLPLLWFAFCLLFAFWLAAVFLNLRGGLTTYSLVLIGNAATDLNALSASKTHAESTDCGRQPCAERHNPTHGVKQEI
jgi:hypothetical protein